MERYLNQKQILKFPVGKKYKKTNFGGARVFIKEKLKNINNEKYILEFYCQNNRWKISEEEKKKSQKKHISSAAINKVLSRLNTDFVKKPIKFPVSKSYYAEIYQNYADAEKLGYYSKNSPEYIRVLDILKNIKKGTRVYDVGCNSGGIGSLLIKKGCFVWGSEICSKLAKKASKKGIKVFNGWAENAPFEDSFFDYAILTFVLEHVINPEKIMNETLRVLKSGGTILGHVPTEYGDWGRHTIGIHPEHLRAYSNSDLKKLFDRFKLKDVKIEKKKLVGRKISDYYFFMAKK